MISFFSVCFAGDEPEVETGLGKIKGSYRTALRGKRYCAFEGIPYAKPPIDNLRFEVSFDYIKNLFGSSNWK